MNLWIIFALIWVLFRWVANTAMKKVAMRYENNYTALFFQYISVALFALVFVVAISTYMQVDIFPTLDLFQYGVLAVVGVIWFAWIALLYKAFDHLCSGVSLIVANLSVFLMYFANLYLFDASESLPVIQIVLAVLFFVIVAQFLWTESTCPTKEEKKWAINWNIIYPVWTALCWTVFFVGNTWFVKNEIMSPVQSVFATETTILLVVILFYALRFKADFSDLYNSLDKKDILPFSLIGLWLVGWNFMFYYGYLDNPANIINFIRLFSIIATAIFSWIFLKDYMSKKQIWLMIAAFLVLIIFIFAEDILTIFF